MKTLNGLMKHLRDKGIETHGSVHKRKMKNYGYYHGYKGHRFVGSSSNCLELTSFDEVIALNEFDMAVKALLYPSVMFIETALKNYTLEAVLEDSHSFVLEDIFSRTLVAYRDYPRKSKDYSAAMKKRLGLRAEINRLIQYNYSKNPVVRHFYDSDKPLPIWALFEVMTLGNFGVFYSCLKGSVRQSISDDLKLPNNYDGPGLLERSIFVLKDLRNAIAHNSAVYDVRFKRAKVGNQLGQMLSSEVGVPSIDFSTITDYVVLIVYLLRKMMVSKTECYQLIRNYSSVLEDLHGSLSSSDFHKIVKTGARSKMDALRSYIAAS